MPGEDALRRVVPSVLSCQLIPSSSAAVAGNALPQSLRGEGQRWFFPRSTPWHTPKAIRLRRLGVILVLRAVWSNCQVGQGKGSHSVY